MPAVRATTSVQLARADAIGKALTRQGWTARHETRSDHPGAVAVGSHTRLGTKVLVVTMGARHGQLVEVIGAGVPAGRTPSGGHSTGARPSWRLTAYNPSASAVLAAAAAACTAAHYSGVLETNGWQADRTIKRNIRTPRTTTFTYPGGAVAVTFHVPTFTPPCPSCGPGRECGDSGGWIVNGPCFMEASTHTPESVIAAFVQGLPDAIPCTSSVSDHAAKARRRTKAAGIAARSIVREEVC